MNSHFVGSAIYAEALSLRTGFCKGNVIRSKVTSEASTSTIQQEPSINVNDELDLESRSLYNIIMSSFSKFRFRELQYLNIFILLLLVVLSQTGMAKDAIPARIVVVGDIHGDYDRMLEVLQLGSVVDKRGRWIGKKTHLVQLGDLPDRGPDTRKVIQFLKDLEKSAKRKGGKVHILIGNHDAMNVYGDLRYVTSEEYQAFKDKNSQKRLENLFKNEVKWIQENIPEEEWPIFDETYRNEWFARRPPGFLEHRWDWLPDGETGKWTLSHDAVLKIGKYLFIHAGIGPAFANKSVQELNDMVRDSLENSGNVENTILRHEEGPLWYRGFARNPEDEEVIHLEEVLTKHGVEHIFMGHTVTGGVILPRFDGKAVLVDVGLSNYYGDNMACLVIEEGRLTAVHRTGSVTLPDSTEPESILSYIKEVSKLEPNNQSIVKRIQSIEAKQLNEESILIGDPY